MNNYFVQVLFGLAPAIFGALVGYLVVLLIRFIVLFVLRRLFSSAFYRKRPLASNIMFVVLEVWNIGLAVGFVLGRAVKLFVLSAMFVGRIDTPFLASGVDQLGPIDLDGSVVAFRQDILMQDAHRHVLIELFGDLCLMKLRSGSSFALQPGSAWRLLYVLTVMPWLRKYHVTDPDTDVDETIAKMEEEIDDEQDLDKRDALKSKLSTFVRTIRTDQSTDSESEVAVLRKHNAVLEKQLLGFKEQLKNAGHEALAASKEEDESECAGGKSQGWIY